MKWFSNIFNNNEMTQEKLDEIKSQLSAYPKFQWIKSERKGEVVLLKDVTFDKNIWVEFNNGSRINYGLFDEYILKISSDGELLDFEKNTPGQASVGTAKIKTTPIKQDNPIYALLKKQKPNLSDVEISLKLNLPSSELYKVLGESFENAETEIINFIVADLDINMIKDSVKEAIQKYYTEKNQEA